MFYQNKDILTLKKNKIMFWIDLSLLVQFITRILDWV